MQTESESKTQSYLDDKAASNADVYGELARYHGERLWFQMSERLLALSQLESFASSPQLYELYERVVLDAEEMFKPIHVAQVAVAAAGAVQGDARRSFLAGVAERLSERGEVEAAVYVNMSVAEALLEASNTEECLVLLESSKALLDKVSGVVDALVRAAFHRASLRYHKVKGPASQFFDHAILYLAYRPMESLPPKEAVELSADTGLAALVGAGVFSFGELLQHPVVDRLRGTEHEWLAELLVAFNRGDIDGYGRIAEAHARTQPVLARNAEFLNQKIRVMALMELVFSRPSDNRTISFADISKHCHLAAGEVELLVIMAISAGVLRGKIDQVDENVAVTWVQPRVLDIDQLRSMRDRTVEWAAKVEQASILLENGASELLRAK